MNNFKIVDRVVCIDNSTCIFINKYNIYTVIPSINNYIKIDNLDSEYHYRRFITLSEYRKQKIKEIYE